MKPMKVEQKINNFQPTRVREISVEMSEHMKDWNPQLNVQRLKHNVHEIIRVAKTVFKF